MFKKKEYECFTKASSCNVRIVDYNFTLTKKDLPGRLVILRKHHKPIDRFRLFFKNEEKNNIRVIAMYSRYDQKGMLFVLRNGVLIHQSKMEEFDKLQLDVSAKQVVVSDVSPLQLYRTLFATSVRMRLIYYT